MSGGLSKGAGHTSKYEYEQISTAEWQSGPFFQRESRYNSCGHRSSLLIFKMDERVSSAGDPGTERAVEWIGWRAGRRWLFHRSDSFRQNERARHTTAGTVRLE